MDSPGVKPDELKKMIESKAPDFVVVSNDPQESFDKAHIPGALSFPAVDQIKRPVNLPRTKTLILYCACAHEEDSSNMAAKLALKWMELKYPLEKK